jgi:hypothetical protein
MIKSTAVVSHKKSKNLLAPATLPKEHLAENSKTLPFNQTQVSSYLAYEKI